MSQRRHGHDAADAVLREELVQLVYAIHGLPVKTHDDVAFAQSDARGRAVRFNREHEHTGLLRQPVMAHQPPVQAGILSADTDETAAHPAILDEPTDDMSRRVHANGEAESL